MNDRNTNDKSFDKEHFDSNLGNNDGIKDAISKVTHNEEKEIDEKHSNHHDVTEVLSLSHGIDGKGKSVSERIFFIHHIIHFLDPNFRFLVFHTSNGICTLNSF